MDVTHNAGDSQRSFRDAGGQGTIVFDPDQVRQAGPELFDPAAYGAQAQPVLGSGGRGAAWFVRGSFGQAVLRHYRRGGWRARFGADTFLWRGERRVRSLREFRLLQRLHSLRLPVPVPVAAFYVRRAWRYRAAIIVTRVPDARSFAAEVAVRPGDAPWAEVGRAIGACHRAGAHHADLNAQNILLGPDSRVCLIDWDKGVLESAPGSWCQRVLGRLQRSLLKECMMLDPSLIHDGMARLRAAHDQELAR